MATTTTPAATTEVDLPLNQRQHSQKEAQAVMDYFNSPTFGRHVEDLISKWHAPGLAVALVHDQTILSRGFGLAAIDPPRKCTPDTIFDIASSSKSMTAASVGLLVGDDEKYPDVQWDAVMNQLLPDDFVMSQDEYTQSVTVEDILSHRSGLSRHDSSYLGTKAERPDNARSVTRNLRNLSITAPIRTKWMYCNMMFTVASYLVEQKSGMTFEDFLHRHFFEPLGMESSHLQPETAKRAGLEERMAKPYEWAKKTEGYREMLREQTPEAQGAGSIQTSVNDYIKYVKAMIHREGPITEDLYQGVTRLRAFCNPDMDQRFDPYCSIEAYAAGWETYWYRGSRVVQHDGLIDGFAATHFFLPDWKFGAVMCSNAEGGADVIIILVKELIDELLGITHDERVDWNARQRAEEERAVRRQAEEKDQLRKELGAGDDGLGQAQEIPLSTYVGEYWNAGYHGMTVQVKDGKLHVDAHDRSPNGMRLTFEHITGQTQYVVHLEMGASEIVEELKGEFRFENGRVVKMGIDFDDMIWFDRVEEHDGAST